MSRALANRPDVIIATRVSPVDGPETSRFTYESVRQGTERCLRLLKRETIDILQTHGNGSVDEVSNPELIRAFEDLQKNGKIRARASATFNADDARHAIENGHVEGLQVTYNLLDRSHTLPVLELAAERGVGLPARMPDQRGSLTGKFSPDREVPDGHRAMLQGDKLAADIERQNRRAPQQAGSRLRRDLGSTGVAHCDRQRPRIAGASSVNCRSSGGSGR